MKKIILIATIILTTLNAKEVDFKNPNGRPFLLTASIYGEHGFYLTLPISKWITIGAGLYNPLHRDFHPNKHMYIVTGADNANCDLNSGGEGYCNISGEFTARRIETKALIGKIDIHIPLYKLWEK